MSSGVGDQVVALTAAVATLHGDLAVGSAWQPGEAELLRVAGSLVRLRAGVEAAYLRAVAEVDRRRSAGPLTVGPRSAGSPGSVDGPRGAGSGIGASTESSLRPSAPLTPGQARADVSAARALAPDGSLRELEPALAAGDITRAHVDVATRCLDTIPRHLRSSDEDRATIAGFFADLAPTRHALTLKLDAAALLARLAPEAVDRFDPHAHERRFLDLTTDATGMLLGHFALDPAAGATLRAAVDSPSAPTPSTDGTRDERTARQRRADALLGIADTALAVSAPVRGERPRVVVRATAEQLAGFLAARSGVPLVGAARTDAGSHLDPEAPRRVACDAVLQRVVWDRDGALLSAMPLDLGRTARLVDVHLRRALAARDRGCIIPGCGAQPAHCDAHHVTHWATAVRPAWATRCFSAGRTTPRSMAACGRSALAPTGCRRWCRPTGSTRCDDRDGLPTTMSTTCSKPCDRAQTTTRTPGPALPQGRHRSGLGDALVTRTLLDQPHDSVLGPLGVRRDRWAGRTAQLRVGAPVGAADPVGRARSGSPDPRRH